VPSQIPNPGKTQRQDMATSLILASAGCWFVTNFSGEGVKGTGCREGGDAAAFKKKGRAKNLRAEPNRKEATALLGVMRWTRGKGAGISVRPKRWSALGKKER